VRHESELGPLMEKHAIKMTELINYIFFMNKKGLTRPPNVKQALFNQMVEEIGDQLKEWIPFLKKMADQNIVSPVKARKVIRNLIFAFMYVPDGYVTVTYKLAQDLMIGGIIENIDEMDTDYTASAINIYTLLDEIAGKDHLDQLRSVWTDYIIYVRNYIIAFATILRSKEPDEEKGNLLERNDNRFIEKAFNTGAEIENILRGRGEYSGKVIKGSMASESKAFRIIF